jgi:ribonuclease VapC
MVSVVLDASAYLAMLKSERGWHRVLEVLPNAVMTSINAAEIYAKLSEWQAEAAQFQKCQAILESITVAFDHDLAVRTGAMHAQTKGLGLSIGDRSCLALAQRLGVPAMTADKIWQKADLAITVELIR